MKQKELLLIIQKTGNDSYNEENNDDSNNSNGNLDNNVDNSPKYEETQISTFSTKIYSSDPARQNNVKITCDTLNETIVKAGDTFSFCNTVGQATTSKGYQKAEIFDSNGNKKKGLGGGNCQVSSTLYNAVTSCPDLVVTERHQHSNYVPYIQKGKDAAVAYGSYDFKFRNNSANDIKIICTTDNKNITTTLIAIKQIN